MINKNFRYRIVFLFSIFYLILSVEINGLNNNTKVPSSYTLVKNKSQSLSNSLSDAFPTNAVNTRVKQTSLVGLTASSTTFTLPTGNALRSLGNVTAAPGEKKYLVTLNIYSGRPNPTYILTQNEINQLNVQMSAGTVMAAGGAIGAAAKSPPVLGYRGFEVTELDTKQTYTVRGMPQAEAYLTNLVQGTLNVSENYQVRSEIPKMRVANTLVMANAANETAAPTSNVWCNSIPMRCSGDKIPVYNPSKDCLGCFVTRVAYNNCYNYASSILTNSFAQPGKAHGRNINMTCNSVARAAIADGLIWTGTRYPNARPRRGHYVALVIWPDNDFHWLRLDRNGQWSHKPGITPVKNYDNDYKPISNPSGSNLQPYKFCGYLGIIPTRARIN